MARSYLGNIEKRAVLRFLHGPTAMLMLAFFLAGCGSSADDRSGHDTRDTTRVLVRTQAAVIRQVEEHAQYNGRVDPFEQNHICAGIAGRILRVHVDVGDRVQKGQLLVEMDPTQALTLRAQLVTLERDYQRLDTLQRIGSIPRQQFDQLKTQYEVTKAQLENLERNTRLLSPINGVITGKYYHDGELFAMAPTPQSGGRAAILSVMQIDPVKVLINIPERLYPRAKAGLEVAVTLDAYGERKFVGRIYRIAPIVDAITHTAEVEISVPNGEGLLRPGMYARVQIPYGRMDRILVPDLAIIHQRGTNEKALFIDDNGTARRVVVELGQRQDNLYEILSGLEGKEQIIVSGIRQLRNGSPIRIVQ